MRYSWKQSNFTGCQRMAQLFFTKPIVNFSDFGEICLFRGNIFKRLLYGDRYLTINLFRPKSRRFIKFTPSENMVINVGKQCIAVGSQRGKKLVKIKDLCKIFVSQIKNLSASIQRLRNGLLQHCLLMRSSILFAAVAFQVKSDSETLNRISLEMNLLSPSEKAPAVNLDKFLQEKKWEKSIDVPKSNLIGWRRPVGNSGLYEYKLFCRFHDVSAKSFFQSQMDLEYRKTWDDRIVTLEIVESDKSENADTLHWVTRFPWPMAPREYVFHRRYSWNEQDRTIVLLQHSVDCPDVLEKSSDKNYVHVEHYTSDWIIRPHTTFEENGFDFILTYFDDPKGSYPNSTVKYLANKGVPGYVETMHKAAKKYQDTQQQSKNTNSSTKAKNKGQTNEPQAQVITDPVQS